jgi:alkylation response protein AidB-like acyl-CoA dehydrogenase
VRDGDDYIIKGQKIFVGSDNGTDRIWLIACTDPKGKRHENLSWFMIDAKLPGISMQPMELMGTGGEGGTDSGVKQTVFFDDVRVPAFSLVGGENKGWDGRHDAPGARARRRRPHRPQTACGIGSAALLPGDQARWHAAEPAAGRAR